MNKLIKEETKRVWSDRVKDLINFNKCCVFYTNDHNYIIGWVEDYDPEGYIYIYRHDRFRTAQFAPDELMLMANCSVYHLKSGVTANPPSVEEINQGGLVKTKTIYLFKDIDTKRLYTFKNKDGFIVFLRCVKWDEHKATFQIAAGFSNVTKEYTAEEFAEAFEDNEDNVHYYCPFYNKVINDEED